MYCLPLDNVCQWDQFQHKLIAAPAEDYKVNMLSFELGTFNGLVYTYVWDDKHPVIFVDEVDAPPRTRPKVIGELHG